ncbi:hypothetical protein [Anaerocaecibacter muris]|uniref:hypothetical protein n=1 Tax=Anaerocaecibacter muris TaxID=2941513 RepID=UPI003F68D58A
MTDSNDLSKLRASLKHFTALPVPTNLDGFTYISEAVAFQLLHNPKRWHILYDLVAEKQTFSPLRQSRYQLLDSHPLRDVKSQLRLDRQNHVALGIISSCSLHRAQLFKSVDISLDSDTDVDVPQKSPRQTD